MPATGGLRIARCKGRAAVPRWRPAPPRDLLPEVAGPGTSLNAPSPGTARIVCEFRVNVRQRLAR
jgi:hypothetical protein